jgi:hypothetical protein
MHTSQRMAGSHPDPAEGRQDAGADSREKQQPEIIAAG